MKVIVFLHGTILMHKSALGCTREERVKQVVEREETIWDFSAYIPISGAATKLHTWKNQGADIFYLSSHITEENVQKDKDVLRKYNFPEGEVLFRMGEEGYGEIVERIMPDVLIEDDCESIGREKEMVYPHLHPEVRSKIKSIVVKEFGGIDHLADDIFITANL
jgi:hypothetical protein